MSSPRLQDEETPLLQRDNALRKPTSLPKAQLFLVLLIRLAEPITANSIIPYISEVRSPSSPPRQSTRTSIDVHILQLVSEFSTIEGDRRKVGYYMGIIVRLSPILNIPACSSRDLFLCSRYHCILPPKRPPCSNGAVSLTTSVASQFSCSVC